MKEKLKIHKTKDYDKFFFNEKQRSVKPRNVAAIVRDVQGGRNIFSDFPIIVSTVGDKFMIHDGQHRYTACKQLGLPVYYKVADNTHAEDVAYINNSQRSWVLADYVDSFSKDNDHYARLKLFSDTFGIMLSAAGGILAGTNNFGNGGKAGKAIREGDFKVRSERTAVAFGVFCKKLSDACSSIRMAATYQVLWKMFKHPKFDNDWFINRVKKLAGKRVITRCSSIEDALDMVTAVYNNQRPKPKKIRCATLWDEVTSDQKYFDELADKENAKSPTIKEFVLRNNEVKVRKHATSGSAPVSGTPSLPGL